MISRRLVRIKALQALYSYQQGGSTDNVSLQNLTPTQQEHYQNTLANLNDSINQSYDFFLFLLDLPFQLSTYLLEKQTIEKSKFYPDQQKIRDLSILDRMPLVKYLHRAVEDNKRKQFPFDWSELVGQYDQYYEWMQTSKIGFTGKVGTFIYDETIVGATGGAIAKIKEIIKPLFPEF